MTSTLLPVRLLGLSGSLRGASHSSAVLRNMSTLLPEHVAFEAFPLHDIPLYNQDVDDTFQPGTSPEAVGLFRAAITAADGLLIVSPEYNYGMPGVLKNALDWASRPAYASPMKNKPALVVTSSIGYPGGARAQHQITETLSSMLARPVVRPHIAIPSVHTMLADGRLTDPLTRDVLQGGIMDLLLEIARLRAPLR